KSSGRPIDSETPVCLLATLAGLTIYVARSRRRHLLRLTAFRRAVRFRLRLRQGYGGQASRTCPQKQKTRWHSANGHFVLATSYSRTAYRRTTIGAAAFHCRVRNGNGWGHCATVTRDPSRIGGFGAARRPGSLGT